MNAKKLSKKGFTLVELLIVIIIIGILATIGFIAYSGAQNKAKKSDAEATVSQLKNKLGEYYSTNSTYPADSAALSTFITSSEGGNNEALNNKFTDGDFTYACAAGGCDEGFTLTANRSMWKGDTDITVTN